MDVRKNTDKSLTIVSQDITEKNQGGFIIMRKINTKEGIAHDKQYDSL